MALKVQKKKNNNNNIRVFFTSFGGPKIKIIDFYKRKGGLKICLVVLLNLRMRPPNQIGLDLFGFGLSSTWTVKSAYSVGLSWVNP